MADYFSVQDQDDADDVHNSDVQSFMAQVPHSIVRWGLSAVLGVVVLLIWLSSIIRYPDILTLKCILTSTHAPREVKARTDGRITRLLVRENEQVAEGQTLALLETSADHEQVRQLTNSLKVLSRAMYSHRVDSLMTFNQNTFSRLGELQQAFQSLMRDYSLYLPYIANGYYDRKKKLLRQELLQAERLQLVLSEQKETLNRDLLIAQDQLATQQSLYQQKVIPSLEYEQQKSVYLSKKLPVQQAVARFIEGEVRRTAKIQELLEIDNAYLQQQISLKQSIRYLQSLAWAWRQKYELVAPVSGRVHLPGLLQDKANLSLNSTVFTIGGDSLHYFCYAQIPQSYVGKIKPLQKAIVKFDGYPSYEFGAVEGQVNTVTSVPSPDSSFYAQITFSHGLVTQRKNRLAFKQGLTASVEVVMEDRSLFRKFTYDINKVLHTSY